MCELLNQMGTFYAVYAFVTWLFSLERFNGSN